MREPQHPTVRSSASPRHGSALVWLAARSSECFCDHIGNYMLERRRNGEYDRHSAHQMPMTAASNLSLIAAPLPPGQEVAMSTASQDKKAGGWQ